MGVRSRLGPHLDIDSLGLELRERLHRLDSALTDLAGGEGAPADFDPHLYLAPGIPRVRPVLVLLSERAARAHVEEQEVPVSTEDATEHVAVAAELLHLAMLVHDRALGLPGGRRRRAARKLLGAVGWLGANHMTLRALELSRHAPAPEVVGDVLDTLREIAEGHALSESIHGRVASTAEVTELAEGYTGAVFDFACRSGGRIAGADRLVVGGLGRFGRHAGVAWHMADDLSVMSVEDDQLLDALDERLHKRSPNFGVSLGAEMDPRIGELWLQFREGPMSEGDAFELRDRAVKAGVLIEGRKRLAEQSWRARKALSALTPSPDRDALDQLAAGIAK
jgi:geranylgeranyl pyrophosphate synthase